MCAKTENYNLYHQCVSNLYKGVLKTQSFKKYIMPGYIVASLPGTMSTT